jgi:hypothetical protein
MIRVPRFDHRATDQSVGEHGFLMVETVEIWRCWMENHDFTKKCSLKTTFVSPALSPPYASWTADALIGALCGISFIILDVLWNVRQNERNTILHMDCTCDDQYDKYEHPFFYRSFACFDQHSKWLMRKFQEFGVNNAQVRRSRGNDYRRSSVKMGHNC